MGSLFQGSPQTATSYATSSTETPKWMQDAIYNQIQIAQNLANKPYQSYDLPTVAELSPLQQQAYAKVQNNQGFYQADLDKSQTDMYAFGSKGTATDLGTAQGKYLQNPTTVSGQLTLGQGDFTKARGLDAVAAGNVNLNKAALLDIPTAGASYLTDANAQTAAGVAEKAYTKADPYLTAAGKGSYTDIDKYMSPYQTGVMDVIAKQGARNLSENLLPGVSDAFIKAGQFGGTRMGEFGSRALRDTQEAVLNQQAQLANQGYGQALGASQADLARQGQLASTVGNIYGADLSRLLQGANQYQNLASTAGNLTAQQMQNLANIGQTQGQMTSQQMQNLASLGQAQTASGQAQQQFGLNAAQAQQQAQAADYQRQMSALSQFANMQQQEQAMRSADVAALESAGAAQQGQKQRELSVAEQQFMNEQLYPRQQADFLSTQIRGMAPITPQIQTQSGGSTGATYSASPLSQLATGLYTYKGLNALG